MLWLQWFVAFLDAIAVSGPLSRQAHAVAHAWLDRVECLLARIIVIRAAAHVRPIPPRAGIHEHKRRDHGFMRAVLGAELRRALRSRDLHHRIAALRQDIAPLVARLVRRLPRGLTRRRPVLLSCAPRSAPAVTACSDAPRVADTS